MKPLSVKTNHRKLVLKVINFKDNTSNTLGEYDSVEEMSHDYPISTSGRDTALMNADYDLQNSLLVFYQQLNGNLQEITDPRIHLEDLGLV